jgi:general secretion pathway protein A
VSRARDVREGYPMHEDYYGFTEKPFSLTPDPKYLFKSQSHASAFELLQYAIRRREGFVVVTGDIGTGKTTLCRAILEQLDRRTFTALILNPFISEEDLLRLILQDFGVVSRDEIKRGRLARVTKQELIDTLNDFLISLQPIGASALLIIDEAQNLPLQVLEQIRILSNLETDKDKLLQIVLVGQRNLKDLLKSPEVRQLDQRISIRYELTPLNREETAAYISHRLAIAGGSAAVSFAPGALDQVHRYSGGIPRLINLLCDRALLGGYSARTARITPQIVATAAETLELRAPGRTLPDWMRRHALPFAAGLAVMALIAGGTYAAVQLQDGRAAAAPLEAGASTPASPDPSPGPVEAPSQAPPSGPSAAAAQGSPTPPAAVAGRYSVVVASFRQANEAGQLVAELSRQGFRASISRIDTAARGVWHQVRVGPYAGLDEARADEARIRRMPGYGDARLITQ